MNPQMYTQALSGLMGAYEDLRAIGVSCPNEPEFQAYYVLSAADPEVLSGCNAHTQCDEDQSPAWSVQRRGRAPPCSSGRLYPVR